MFSSSVVTSMPGGGTLYPGRGGGGEGGGCKILAHSNISWQLKCLRLKPEK